MAELMAKLMAELMPGRHRTRFVRRRDTDVCRETLFS
jgi:hypothetical protein